jgi:hypothetical protein
MGSNYRYEAQSIKQFEFRQWRLSICIPIIGTFRKLDHLEFREISRIIGAEAPGRGSVRRLKYMVMGLLAGCVITSLPWLARNHEGLWPINFLDLPGAIVAVLLARGNVHNYNFTVLLVTNVGFYAGVTYLCLRPRTK